MKAKERHDLATNELADVLGNVIRKVKPYLSYVLIAAVVIIAVMWWRDKQRKDDLSVSTQTVQGFTVAMATWGADPFETQDRKVEAIEAFLRTHPESPLERLAENALAGELYNRAVVALVDQRDQVAVDADLDRAKQIYERLALGEDAISLWAGYGLACISAQKGQTQEAEEQFLALAARNPGSAIEQLANRRLDTLRHARSLVFDEPAPEADIPADGGDKGSDEPVGKNPDQTNADAAKPGT